MKRSKENKLFERFWKGDTSSEEENSLFNNIDHEESKINESYKGYIRKMRNVPYEIEDIVWDAINKKQKRRIINLSVISIAASILIVAGVFSVLKYQERGRNLDMQFAVIEQALNHASSEISTDNEQDVLILYEDDLITIVAENQINE